jgi:RNA polymerase sigma factor (sigma-70 family)
MTEKPGPDRETIDIQGADDRKLEEWFVREVLPLEAALMQFLRSGWRSKADTEDLCQDVYVRVCDAARKEIPRPAKPFVFAVARNLLINRVRRDQIVSIEVVADPDTFGVALDEPGPDRSVMARQELKKLQAALDRLPKRAREAVVLRKIEGLSYREIATRMGISEDTVSEYLSTGMATLAEFLHGEFFVGANHE